jgi:hypothetical protein
LASTTTKGKQQMIRIENVFISDETLKELERAKRERREQKAADALLSRQGLARVLSLQDNPSSIYRPELSK